MNYFYVFIDLFHRFNVKACRTAPSNLFLNILIFHSLHKIACFSFNNFYVSNVFYNKHS